MKNTYKKSLIAASILAALSTPTSANNKSEDSINSTIDLSFRYRVETVDQQNFVEDATASTLRTRATIKTKWADNWNSVIEFDDVSEIGSDNFNSGMGTSGENRAHYPIVADPEGTEVNQAYIQYSNQDTKFALGRQRILVGNQRFVGGVGWRQNEQTYDSVTFNKKVSEDFSLNASYIFNVNRIFGESVNAGDHKHNTFLFTGDYKLNNGKLSGYYFSIDNEDAAALSNSTFGLRYSGKVNAFSYSLEFASQSDTGDNPVSYDANYYLLEGNYKFEAATIGAGYEVLGGDSDAGKGFTTSLATLHKFQGWADVFLGTPAQGIKDFYLNTSFAASGFKFKFIYHDFKTDVGGIDLGSELDLVVSKKFSKNYSGLLKFASFDSDNVSYPSRDKIWFMLTYKP